jgi:hypothetical protein
VAGGGGAGAGIGGNGGNGGNGNAGLSTWDSTYSTDYNRPYTGDDGESGENCGDVNINGVTVYAYGGAGGSSLSKTGYSNDSGSGGGGYPAAGIGGGGAGGGGGDHANGGGGYSGGTAQPATGTAINGRSGNGGSFCSGGSYFESGRITDANQVLAGNVAMIGGQGGTRCTYSGDNDWYRTGGGDGGIAGKGGRIFSSNNATIYAYNGNECTLDSEDENYYNTPLTIYAQNGVLRNIYKYNFRWNVETERSYSFFYSLFGNTINTGVDTVTIATESRDTVVNVLVRAEQIINKTNYINPNTGSEQGIGSGAGYIELSNGTYTVD